MQRIIFLLVCLFCVIANATPVFSQEFNNIPLTDREMNLEVERAFAEGVTNGFSGIRPFSKVELLNAYHDTKDVHIYRFIKKDLMEVGMSPDGKTIPSSFYLEPLTDVTFRAYNFSTNVPGKKKYCLENMEGNCLDEGFNAFTNVTGQARLHNNVTFYYEGELKYSKEETKGLLKKAYIKVKTGPVTWEFGKDSLWLGHGYRGSLLLSNNAEPFPLFKVQVERPFDLPLQYTLFHGWLDDFNILGHRLAWKPFSILELGANQTSVYRKDKNFKVWDWPHLFFSSEENVPGATFNTDQRGSLDIALYMPFVNKVPYLGLKGGKIYAEYGGEDTFAWWQKEDKTWHGPLGFEFLGGGYILGLYLTTGNTDFHYEYAENYESHPLLWDWYAANGINKASKGEQWYRGIPFLSKDLLMGHIMGPEGENNYFELRHRISDLVLTGFYERRRNHLYNKIDQYNIFPATPVERRQFGLEALYSWKSLDLSATIIHNVYRNTDISNDPLKFNIVPGLSSKETVIGVGIRYIF